MTSLSQEEFVLLMHDLGDAALPPDPGRREIVHRRVGRIRRRRATIAAAMAAVIVAAGIGGVAVARHRGSVSAGPAFGGTDPAPESLVAEDGVSYHRVGTAELDTTGGRALAVATLTVPVAGDALSVRATCVSGNAGGGVTIRVANRSEDISCDRAIRPLMVDLDVSAARSGGTVTIAFNDGGPTKWTFAVYVWRVPATLSAVAAPELPAVEGNWHLEQVYTGAWPDRRSVTFTIPIGNAKVIATVCSSTIVGGEGAPGNVDESPSGDGTPYYCQAPSTAPTLQYNGTGGTITLTFALDRIYDVRGGSWAVGIYGS